MLRHRNHKLLMHMAMMAPLLCASCSTIGLTKNDEHIDRMFSSDNIQKTELNAIAEDIAHYGRDKVSILVKYEMRGDLGESQGLAQVQGDQLKSYLQQRKIKLPIAVFTTPVGGTTPNQIWISYHLAGHPKLQNAPREKAAADIATPAHQPRPETLAEQFKRTRLSK